MLNQYMNNDILLYKTLINHIPLALLVEDENRNITLTNQPFCDLFEIKLTPEQMTGYDSAQAAEEVKYLMDNPDSFLKRIESLLLTRQPVQNELVEMKNGTKLLRDYIPVFNDEFHLGHVWLYKDITHIHRIQENKGLDD